MDQLEKQSLNWFPGHMKKARLLIKENLKNIDIIYEIVDARAPMATRNSSIFNLIKNKLRVIILGKSDLAEDCVTKEWIKKIRKQEQVFVFAIDCKNRKHTKEVIRNSHKILQQYEEKKDKKNIRVSRFRAMVIGVPNVGKSSFVNSIAGRKKAKTGDFPGITKSEQWVKIDEFIDLLDTPGNLNFENKEGNNKFILELLGSIKSGVFDVEDVALKLLMFLKEQKPDIFKKIFNKSDVESDNYLLEEYCKIKHIFRKKAELDLTRASEFLIKEFRNKKFGKISLQTPYDMEI